MPKKSYPRGQPAKKKGISPPPAKKVKGAKPPKSMPAARGRYGDTSHNPKGRFAGGMSQCKYPLGSKRA